MLILGRWFGCAVEEKEQFRVTEKLGWWILHLVSNCTGIPLRPPQSCGVPIAFLPIVVPLQKAYPSRATMKNLRLFLATSLSHESAAINRVGC